MEKDLVISCLLIIHNFRLFLTSRINLEKLKERKEEKKRQKRKENYNIAIGLLQHASLITRHMRGEGGICSATGCSFTESGSSVCKTRLVHPAPALSACTATHGQGALRLLTPFLDGLAHQSAGTGHNIIGKTKAESFECARHKLVSAQLFSLSGSQLAWSKEFCVARHY